MHTAVEQRETLRVLDQVGRDRNPYPFERRCGGDILATPIVGNIGRLRKERSIAPLAASAADRLRIPGRSCAIVLPPITAARCTTLAERAGIGIGCLSQRNASCN